MIVNKIVCGREEGLELNQQVVLMQTEVLRYGEVRRVCILGCLGMEEDTKNLLGWEIKED